MVTEPSSIAKLKAYYGDRLYVEDQDALMSELMEGNDRSAIIAVAAMCDASLEARIAMALPGLEGADKRAVDHAFRHGGSLGSFSGRIDLAFYMGLIDSQIQKQLHDLRHIRNAVAHTKRRVTFADVELQNAAKRLFRPYGTFKLLNDTPDGYRRTLISEGMLLWNAIQDGRDTAIESCRASFVAAGRPDPFR